MSTETIAYPNTMNRVISMDRKEFVNRMEGRISSIADLYNVDELLEIREDIINRANKRFDELLINPEYKIEE